MAPAVCTDQVSALIPPPSYHRSLARALHLDALTLVRRLQLLALCEVAVQLAQQQCSPPLPAGPGGTPRIYQEESLLLLALLRTLWRLSFQELHDWLCAWPALALACGLPRGWMASHACPVRRSSPSGCGRQVPQRVRCCSCCWCGLACGWGSRAGATSS
jgi:hypothetical protein